MPSITSPSTRFFGQPNERKPIFIDVQRVERLTTSRINAIQHPRIGNGFAQVIQSADPADDALDSHSEPSVGDAAEAPEVEVPLERLLREIVLLDAFDEQVVIVQAFAAADDLAIPF